MLKDVSEMSVTERVGKTETQLHYIEKEQNSIIGELKEIKGALNSQNEIHQKTFETIKDLLNQNEINNRTLTFNYNTLMQSYENQNKAFSEHIKGIESSVQAISTNFTALITAVSSKADSVVINNLINTFATKEELLPLKEFAKKFNDSYFLVSGGWKTFVLIVSGLGVVLSLILGAIKIFM